MKNLLLLSMLCGLFICKAEAKGIKTSYRNVLVYAYSQANSVYEDDNIRLEIYNQKLWAKNKTNKTIFIDLSQCFMVHNGSSFPLFDEKQDARHASKKGVTTSIDEFRTIAPSTGNKQNATFICNMDTGIYGEYTTTSTPSQEFTEYDKRLFSVISELTAEAGSEKGTDYFGTASRHFTEDESINNIGASIAYAFNKKSEDWTPVTISTWVSDVIFAPCFVVIPESLKKKDRAGFAAKEVDPVTFHIKADTPFEFDIDRSPIVVSDWTGSFKKGTFRLKDVTVYKNKKKDILLALATYGASLLLTEKEAYKSVIQFDGAKADWGELSYAKSMDDTEQKK